MCSRCGETMTLKEIDFITKYKSKEFKVLNVPMYECSCQAINFSRKIRIQIKSRLKEAYQNNINEINFE